MAHKDHTNTQYFQYWKSLVNGNCKSYIGIEDHADEPSLWRASGTAWFEGQIRKIFLCWRREKLFLQSPIDKGVNLDDKHSYQLASGYNLEHMDWCDVLGS